MIQINPQHQRYLALTILIVLILLIHNFIISPVFNRYQQANAQIDSLQFQLQRYRHLAASQAGEEAQLQQVKYQTPLKEYLLDGATPSVISAKLQQHLKQLVASTGGRIVSTQGINSATDSGLPSVTLKVQLKTSIDQLKELLFHIENSRPTLHIENLTITSTPVRSSSYARKQVIQPLNIRFNLTGYTNSTLQAVSQ